MHTLFPVSQLSNPDRPAVHAYYDLVPESPDGKRILYFEFEEDEIPGPGRVICADRDGTQRRAVGPRTQAIGHTGTLPQWHSDQEISYLGPLGAGKRSVCESLSRENQTEMVGYIRQFHFQTGQALILRNEATPKSNPLLSNTLLIQAPDGRPQSTFSTADAHQAYPHKGSLPAVEECSFMNAKWSQDGTRFLVVFAGADPSPDPNQKPERRVKAIMIGNADGSEFRFLSDFGHHPMWSPDQQFVLAFTRNEFGHQDLMKYPLHGEKTALIENAKGVHASLHPNMRHLVVDAFNFPEKGKASILLYDLNTGNCENLATFDHVGFDHEAGCHPHPVWSRDFRRVYFNAKDSGRPQLYVMDLSEVL